MGATSQILEYILKKKPDQISSGNNSPLIIIAKRLLNSYLILTVVIVIINISLLNNKDAKNPENWFSLMKDNFVLLGTFLSTVVGYYFGQKNEAKEAEQKVGVEKEKNRAAEAALQNQVKVTDNTINKIATTSDSPKKPDETEIRRKPLQEEDKKK